MIDSSQRELFSHLAFGSALDDDFDEIGQYDSDYVDPELEAALYAKIFHREQDWYEQSTRDACRQEEAEAEINENASPAAAILNGVGLHSVEKEESGARIKRSFFVDEYDGDVEESAFEEDKTHKFDVSSNVDGVERSLKQRRRLEKSRDRNRKRFLRTPQSEWNIKFSVAEIQQYLGGTSEDWQVCAEDSNYSIFGERYYGKRIQMIQCRRCREYGHRQKHCNAKTKPCCVYCGDSHHKWKCRDRYFCILCLQPGHTSAACGRNNGAAIVKETCHRCGQSGHRANVCPELWRQFHSTTSFDDRFQLQQHGLLWNMESRPRPVYCYNCGGAGHLGHECRKKTSFGGRLICSKPTVSHYDTSFPERSYSSPMSRKQKTPNSARFTSFEVNQTYNQRQSAKQRRFKKRLEKRLQRETTKMQEVDGQPITDRRKSFQECMVKIEENRQRMREKKKRQNERRANAKTRGNKEQQQSDASGFLAAQSPKRNASGRSNFDKLLQKKLCDSLTKTLKRPKADGGQDSGNARKRLKKSYEVELLQDSIGLRVRARHQLSNDSQKEEATGSSSDARTGNWDIDFNNSFSWDQSAGSDGTARRSAWF